MAAEEEACSRCDTGSHLHTNFKYCLGTNLISDENKQSFDLALQCIGDKCNSTYEYWQAACSLIGQSSSGSDKSIIGDFRMPSKPISFDDDIILFNIKIREKTSLLRRAKRPAKSAIIWLTSHDIMQLIETENPKTLDELLKLMFDCLGLKVWTDEGKIKEVNLLLQIYKLKPTGKLYRPTAFSGGYADRHCAYSALPLFGTTLNNVAGQRGAPEAISTYEQVQEIKPSKRPDGSEYHEYDQVMKEIFKNTSIPYTSGAVTTDAECDVLAPKDYDYAIIGWCLKLLIALPLEP